MSQRPASRNRRRNGRRTSPTEPQSPSSRSTAPRQPSPPSRREGGGGRWLIVGAAVLVLVLGSAVGFLALGGTSASPGASSAGAASSGPSEPGATAPGAAAGAGADTQWPADPPGFAGRMTAAGLPVLSAEGTALHIHQHIDIFVNGRQVTVPAGIGIDEASGSISPIHTHDDSGVIHVESPTVRDFTLGQFFDVWGVKLTPTCLGDVCAGSGQQLAVYVNGARVPGDPRSVTLQAHQEIVVVLGSPAQLPNPIPSSYEFAPGL